MVWSTFLLPLTSVSSTADRRGVRRRGLRGVGAKAVEQEARAKRAVARVYLRPIMVKEIDARTTIGSWAVFALVDGRQPPRAAPTAH